jgi:hypothetical protein
LDGRQKSCHSFSRTIDGFKRENEAEAMFEEILAKLFLECTNIHTEEVL